MDLAQQLTNILLATASSKLATQSGNQIHELLKGDAAERATRRAFERAFTTMLENITVPQGEEQVTELAAQLEAFLRDEFVASKLTDAAIYRQRPPLEDLCRIFEESYDPSTFQTDFKKAMEIFVEALEQQLMHEVSKPDSPLVGRVLVALREQVREVQHGVTQVTYALRNGSVFSVRIENFLKSYLGSEDTPVTFGGRDAEMATLDGWLDGVEAPPYLFLDGPAGRGKSALLVRWIQRLAGREGLKVVFVPVSIRFRTNLSMVFFKALAARLAEAHNEDLPTLVSSNVEDLRDIVYGYLERPLTNGVRLLVVVDGLDEAADWEAGPDLFPTHVPQGIKICTSARTVASDGNSSTWLERLGWEPTGNAEEHHLGNLSRQGVADMAMSIEWSLSDLEQNEIVDELYRLSSGDPLLVELYIDHLRDSHEKGTPVQARELEKRPPGLSEFLQTWWREQESLWGQNSPLERDDVQTVLNLLSCALGPLTVEDLRALSQTGRSLSSHTIRLAVGHLRRFVVGNGEEDGYVFGHPRLAEYFRGRLVASEQQDYDSRFLLYGRETMRSLEERKLGPGMVSLYLIQYYGAHLDRAEGPWGDYRSLVSEGWMQAWKAFEGWYEGFLNDVGRAWDRAEDQHSVALQIRCALCFSSVAALYSNVPPRLLYAALSNNLLTLRQALTMAIGNCSKDKTSFEALVLIFPLLDQQLRIEAFDAVCNLQEDYRAQSLVMIAPYLLSDLMLEAFEVSKAIGDPFYRSRTLEEILYYLPQVLKEDARAESLEAAYLLPDMSQGPQELEGSTTYANWYEGVEDRIDALANLGCHDEALDLLQEIPEGEQHEQALARVSKIIPLDILLRQYDPSQILEALSLWPMNSECWQTISSDLKLAQTPRVRGEIIRRRGELAVRILRRIERECGYDALQYACTIQDPYARAMRQADLGSTVESIGSALEIEEDGWRLQTLRTLLSGVQLDEELSCELEKLASPVRYMEDLRKQVQLLVVMGERSSKEKRDSLLSEALLIVESINEISYRAEVLVEAGYIREALAIVPKVQDDFWRARLLDHLAPLLPVESIPQAFDLAQRIDDKVSRIEFFQKVASDVSENLKERMLDEVRSTANIIATAEPDKFRPSLISFVRSLVALGSLDEALALALNCSDVNDRRASLLELVPLLSCDQRRVALEAGLKAAKIDTGSYEGYVHLQSVLPYLPEDMIDDAFEIIRARFATGDGFEVEQLLQALAPFLTSELIEEALEIVLQLEYGPFSMKAIRALAPRLNMDQTYRAFEYATKIEDKEWRFPAASSLAVRLADIGQYDDALTATSDIGSSVYRCATLLLVAHNVPEHLRAEILFEACDVSAEIVDSLEKAWALSCAGVYITRGLEEEISRLLDSTARLNGTSVSLGEVLENLYEGVKERVVNRLFARFEREQEVEYHLWGEIAPHLTTGQVDRAFQIVRNEPNISNKTQAMSVLQPYATPSLRNKWIREFFRESERKKDSDYLLKEPIVGYLGCWAEDYPEEAYEVCTFLLRECATKPRPHFLTDLALLISLLRVSDKDNGVSQVVEEVFETRAWWP